MHRAFPSRKQRLYRASSLVAAIAPALLAAVSACDEGSGPSSTGSISVQAVTLGDVLDPDGYQITIDGIQRATLPATGTATVTGVPVGQRSVRLVGVAEQCTVGGDNPRTVDVADGDTATVDFAITCGTPIGSLRVHVLSTGEDLDQDGYSILASDQSQSVSANGDVLFTGLFALETDVRILDIVPNCALTSPSPVLVTVPDGGVADARFTLECLGPLPNNLAFAADPGDADGGWGVFRVNASGAQLRNLTQSPDDELGAAWSPDGTRIAFNRGGRTFLMNPDGTAVVDLAVNLTQLAWSPDGSKLAGQGGPAGGTNIFSVNADGSGLTQLTFHLPMPTVTGTFGAPSWAPDGTRLVYSGRQGLNVVACWVVGADGSGDAKLKDNCNYPAWSPDATRIAYERTDGHIVFMAPDGSDLADLSVLAGIPEPEPPLPDVVDGAPAWSPDGTQLAFVSNRDVPEEELGNVHRIFVVHADGTGLRRITSSFAFQLDRPTWGPASP
ncbi:MAG TPA: hypothetical protein VHL81_08000 [Gemmatimonadales bacterium]|jgi:TolB protein|nr:hypothetical protein [Gemmatimonadales bacterium]